MYPVSRAQQETIKCGSESFLEILAIGNGLLPVFYLGCN